MFVSLLALLLLDFTGVESWRGLSLRTEDVVPVALVRPGTALPLNSLGRSRLGGSVQECLRELLVGRVQQGDKGLLVDPGSAGEDWETLEAGEVHVLDWFVEGRTTRIQFFERGATWWATSANLLHAPKSEPGIWLLDADADGEFLGARDLVRFGAVPFRPLEGSRVLDDGQHRMEFRLVPSRRGPLLQVREATLEVNSWARPQRVAWTEANRMRNAHGFPPLVFDEQLARALTLHTEYLQHHDPNKQGKLPSYFGEERSRALYTKEGDAASRRGSVNYLQQGQDTENFIQSHERMTHSRRTLFLPGIGRMAFGQTKAWCFMSLERVDDGPADPIWVVPGAGAVDVPLLCNRNWPYPKSFPTLYDEPRGNPISIQVDLRPGADGGQWAVDTIALRVATKREDEKKESPSDLTSEVGGFFFPLSDITQGPCDTWFLVPQDPLEPNRTFEVVANLKRVKGGLELSREQVAWTFQTGGQ